MLLQLEQIQDIPVGAYSGNVQFFNQNTVTVCNSTTKTLLGLFQFDSDLGYPKLNRLATVSGFGQWQPSSAIASDSLFITAYTKDAGNNIISLLNKTITRSQLDFATGYFHFIVELNIIANDSLTVSLNYTDTKGNVLETDEYNVSSGINLSTQKIFVEVDGQMAATLNLVALNNAITSATNLVQNPGFENGLNNWNTDANGNTTVVADPNTGNYACDIFGGSSVYSVNQASSVASSSTPASFLYQTGIFQTGKIYLISFYTKNIDAFYYASTVVVPGYIAQPNNFSDTTQNVSIINVYAYNPTSTQKILIGTVKTGKAYTKSSFVFTAVAGYTALYFETAPASFASSAVSTAQGSLYRQVLQSLGIALVNLPFDPDYSFVLAVRYLMSLHTRLDDVRVSEIVPTIPNPFNNTTKEIRLRDFTTQYIT